MSSAQELARGRESLRGLIEYALREGWRVVRAPGGSLRFVMPGSATVYTGPVDGCGRADSRPVRRSASEVRTHPVDGLPRFPKEQG